MGQPPYSIAVVNVWDADVRMATHSSVNRLECSFVHQGQASDGRDGCVYVCAPPVQNFALLHVVVSLPLMPQTSHARRTKRDNPHPANVRIVYVVAVTETVVNNVQNPG